MRVSVTKTVEIERDKIKEVRNRAPHFHGEVNGFLKTAKTYHRNNRCETECARKCEREGAWAKNNMRGQCV